jgi:hypothetical protein
MSFPSSALARPAAAAERWPIATPASYGETPHGLAAIGGAAGWADGLKAFFLLCNRRPNLEMLVAAFADILIDHEATSALPAVSLIGASTP